MKPRRGVCSPSVTEGEDPADHTEGRETEPLDPAIDYSDVTSENTPLSSQSHLSQLPDTLTENDGSRPQTLAEAKETYREELREGEESKYYCDRRKRADNHYEKFLQTDRFKVAEYDNPQTAMLSLRVDPEVDGVRIPTVNLFEAVKATWRSVYGKFDYQLSDKRGLEYEYAAVVAGTDHWATPHMHIYLWVDGEVSPSAFRTAVSAFIDECKYAPSDGEGNAVEDAVTIRGPEDQEFATEDVNQNMLEQRGAATSGAHYIASQLPHISPPEDATESELLHGATTVAASSKAVHFSDGCWSEEDRETPPEGAIDYSDVTSENSETTHSPRTHPSPDPDSPETGPTSNETGDATLGPTMPKRDTTGTPAPATERRALPEARATGREGTTPLPDKTDHTRPSRACDTFRAMARHSVRHAKGPPRAHG